jgi:hypothetical protein
VAQKQIPFHYGLFYGAMCHWVGREPDQRVRHGDDGFYDFLYYPADEVEKKEFWNHAQLLREFLDHFLITFSGTRVEYSTTAGHDRDKLALRVTIRHPVKKEKVQ